MIIEFEAKKFLKNSKNILCFIFLIGMIIGICLMKQSQLKSKRAEIYSEDSFLYAQLMSDATLVEGDHSLLTLYETSMVSIDNKLKLANREDWKQSIEEEITFSHAINKMSEKVSIPSQATKYNQEYINQKKYMLKNNIKPDDSLYGVSAMYYVREVSKILFSVYGYIFIILLLYDIFLVEKENNHIKFLKTTPIQYNNYRLAKLSLSFILYIIIVIFTLFISFFIGFVLTKDIGKINYPVLFNHNNVLGFGYYFLSELGYFLCVNYIILLMLLILDKSTIKSEVVMVFMIVIIFGLSSFSSLISITNYPTLIVNSLNTKESINWLFQQGKLCQNFIFQVGLMLFLFITTRIILNIKGRKELLG